MPNRLDAQPKGLPAFELLRFLCAFCVLVWHYQHFYYAGTSPAPDFERSAQPLHALLRLAYENGHYGVQAFWAISGYIFHWKYAQAINHRAVGAAEFAALRFSRLYPLHLATLVACALLQTLHFKIEGRPFVYPSNDMKHFAMHLAMASNWLDSTDFGFNGPIWSVSIEALAYGVFFASMRWASSPLAGAAIPALACAALAKLGLFPAAIECVAFFFIGALSAIAREAVESRRALERAAGALAAALFASMCAAMAFHSQEIFSAAPPKAWLAAACALLLFAIAPLQMPPAARAAAQRLGDLTYASYLCHFPIQLAAACAAAAIGFKLPVESPAFLAAYLAASFGAAAIVHRRFEMPAQNAIRRRFFARKTAP